MSNEKNTQDLEFEQMMEQRIRDNFTAPATDGVQISDERLKEMSKKLPEWSLEPPYSAISVYRASTSSEAVMPSTAMRFSCRYRAMRRFICSLAPELSSVMRVA